MFWQYSCLDVNETHVYTRVCVCVCTICWFVLLFVTTLILSIRLFGFHVGLFFGTLHDYSLALGHLKKRDNAASRREAKALLREALKKSPQMLKAYLTLAAIEIYQEEDAKAGEETLRVAMKHFPGNKDLKQMDLDCKGVAQNMGHMVNAGLPSAKYIGDYMYRPIQ